MARKFLNHTMFRIANAERSLKFYEQHFGMKVITKLEVNELGFTNYFLGLQGPTSLYGDTPWYKREGILELCHNHDATPENFHANNGNAEPNRGFGHICFSVPKLEEFCDNLEKAGVKFQKKLADGRQKNIAFALDPDGYWIELIENAATESIRFNHSMIRVKDKDASLEFYTKKLGMEVIDVSDHPNAKFTLFFLAFPGSPTDKRADREGIVELTYNWGTESDPEFKGYHNGNDQPQGFGHFGVAVENVAATLADLKSKGVTIKKDLLDGKMKFIGFVLDPDGYWIEILPQAELPEDIFAVPNL